MSFFRLSDPKDNFKMAARRKLFKPVSSFHIGHVHDIIIQGLKIITTSAVTNLHPCHTSENSAYYALRNVGQIMSAKSP